MNWATWAQAAGVGGFFMGGGSLVLGVQNYRRQRGAPAREERRNERNQLREHLFALKFELEQAIKTMRDGEDIDVDDPGSLTTLRSAIPRYIEVLDVPTERTLKRLDSVLVTVGAWWGLVAGHVKDAKRPEPIYGDPQGRKRASTERDATDGFTTALELIDDIIEQVNRANARE
jgi:hypothetical protein